MTGEEEEGEEEESARTLARSDDIPWAASKIGVEEAVSSSERAREGGEIKVNSRIRRSVLVISFLCDARCDATDCE